MENLNTEGREVAMSTAEQLRMEGEAKGMQKGIQKGREEATYNTARRLLALNMEIEKIALATALPIEEVERIANKAK